MASKKNITTLTMEERLKVLDDLKTSSVSSVAKKYNVHPSTIWRIKNNAPKIMEFFDKNKVQQKRRRIRTSTYDTLEQNLLTWFRERIALGHFVSNAVLLEKAVELKDNLGLPSEFKVSKGWLTGFKNRHNILLVRVHGESASVDEDAAKKFIDGFKKLLEENSGINTENIYNMDETGLLWKALPSKTLAEGKRKSVKDYKNSKEQITVAVCANASGTHKLMPLVINKYENPRALKDCKSNLPVIFKSQKNAWMTQTLFNDWYKNHFIPSVRSYQLRNAVTGKVILLVNNCEGHAVPSELLDDGDFKIMYFPPNTTSLLQPMDQGIIAKLKTVYLQKTLRKATTYAGGINEFQKQYTLKHCIEILHDSWMEVSAEDIFTAWKKIVPFQTDVYHHAIQRDLSILTGESCTEEDVVQFMTSCEEEEMTRSAEENDEYKQEDENLQESEEEEMTKSTEENIQYKQEDEYLQESEEEEMTRSTEENIQYKQEDEYLHESEEEEMTRSTEENIQYKQEDEYLQKSEEEETTRSAEENIQYKQENENLHAIEEEENKTGELEYLFQRLEHHVAGEAPFVQNIFQVFKNHFLGADDT